MKALIALSLAAIVLAGCVVYPVEPGAPYGYGPRAYVAPPVVYYRPYGYYGGFYGHWRYR